MTFRTLLALAVFPVVATVATAVDSNWSLRQWRSDDGLPNDTVTGLAQTSDGYLWVATSGSLARFDGAQFEPVKPSQIASNYHQNVRELLAARDGSLWMGSARGPVLHIKTDNTTEIFTNNLNDLVLQGMAEDGEGGIWLTFSGAQVRRIKDGRVDSFSTSDGLPSGGYVLTLTSDRKGTLWFTRGGYVGQFRNGKFRTLTELRGMSRMQLAGARGGGVWIGTDSKLFKFKEGGTVRDLGSFQVPRPGSEPTQVFEDRAGGVWIGTSDGGLFHHTSAGFQHVETSHPQILCIAQDNERNIWVGTGGGLDRIRPCVVRLEGAANGLPFESLDSICEATNGVLWAATQNGLLVRRTGNRWNTVSTNAGWPGREATCVAADDQGNVWIGAHNELDCFRDGQWQRWLRGDGLASSRIYVLLTTAGGDVWMAGRFPQSLQRWRNGQWKSFELPPDANYIRALAEDAAGNIWAGTSRGSLFRIHGETVTDETTNVFGVSTSVRGICPLPDGRVWFACAGNGLICLYRDGHVGRVTSDQGLPDNYISQAIADNEGYLWLGSDHGIFKARLELLDRVAQGRSPHVQCLQYGRSAGLPGLQANFGHWPTAARSRDGLLWMPMNAGLAVIDPRNDRETPKAPPVLLTRAVLDGKALADYGNIWLKRAWSPPPAPLPLPPEHSRLEFDWTALNFNAPENVNFRYQLDGLDRGWIDGGTERLASYSRLPAGSYRFKVQARNGDGEWGGSRTLDVFVAPFVWQTWWFRTAALLVFTAGVVAVVFYISSRRLRQRLQLLEQQAALERERARIARDIHDDLGGSLTQIALLSGLTQRDSSNATKVGEYIQRISVTTHQVIRLLDEVVWAVNPRNDNLCDLLRYIGQFAVEFLSAAGIKCRVNLPAQIPPQPISSDARHNLFMVAKEALNNIVRHAQAGEVQLSAEISGPSFSLTIADDGKGFNDSPDGAFADGLRNMRQRMEEMNGQCEIKSVPGQGTRVTFRVPVRRNND